MGGGTPEDHPAQEQEDVIRSKSFGRARGMNLGAFMVDVPSAEPEQFAESVELDSTQKDRAVGDMADLFTDAPVEATASAPEDVGLVEAEQQLSRGLMVAMVVVWTAIGAVVGTVLPEFISAVGLLSMACLLYTSPSPRDLSTSRMPSSA